MNLKNTLLVHSKAIEKNYIKIKIKVRRVILFYIFINLQLQRIRLDSHICFSLKYIMKYCLVEVMEKSRPCSDIQLVREEF